VSVAARPLGRSGLATPPLVLGGNVFGWTADEATSFAVLDAFVAGGGTMIDTADVYSAWAPGHSGGESEAVIGRWLKRSGKRDAVVIATKTGMKMGDGGEGLAPDRIAEACEASLRRLGTDRIDLYFAHKDDGAVPLEATLEAFDRLHRAGKVRAIGASNYAADRLTQALDVSEANGWVRYEVLQPLYNLVERPAFEDALQAACADRAVGCIPFYGLAAGFLTGKYRAEADFEGKVRAHTTRKYWTDRGRAVLAALDAVAAAHAADRATPAQVALAWLAARPGVTAPIASATSVQQVEELVGAMHLTLAADEVAALEEASA
jgi:aryl-alcohol dehydrogenase-like predicted oxidoreductase